MIKNFPHASNRLFKSKLPPKNNRNISSLGKLSYGDLFIPTTLFISESPHLTGSFKLRANRRNVGSCWPTMLLQQCCVRLHVASKALKYSNKTVNIGAMTSIILERDVLTKRWPAFWHASQCPTGWASFWVKSLTVRKNARGMPCMPLITTFNWVWISNFFFFE